MGYTRKSSGAGRRYRGRERFAHWYRDNQVYFLTVVCREKAPGLWGEEAKAIFWRQFEKYAAGCGFEPWVTSVLDDHWHTVGWLARGDELGRFMQGVNGSVAKLVNDVRERDWKAGGGGLGPLTDRLMDGRLRPFWGEGKGKNYFDGLLRDAVQGRRTHRYVCIQSERHGVCRDWRMYPHTRVYVAWQEAERRAAERGAWLTGVRYKRYMDDPKRRGGAT